MTKTTKMTLEQFIKRNKRQIDKIIKSKCPNCTITYKDRELWVLNDEELYLWARGQGCKI